MVASMSFSPRSFFTNFSLLHSVECHTSQDELTKSALLNLFGRKGEGGEQFHYYLNQNGFQGLRERDLGINNESAEEFFEGCEQIYERVVTRTNVFDRLRDSDVTEIWRSVNERHTASRMAKPVNIAFAGGNGYGMTISGGVHRRVLFGRTTPSARTVLIKGEYKMPVKRLSELISFR
jgi:hypothetical protein